MNTVSLNPSTNRRTGVQLMSSLLLFATLGFSFPTLSKPKDPVAWITQQFSYRHARRDLGPFKTKFPCNEKGRRMFAAPPQGLLVPELFEIVCEDIHEIALSKEGMSLAYHYTTPSDRYIITTIRFSNKIMARPCNLTVSWRHKQTLKFLVRMRFLELWELKLGLRLAGANLRLHTSTKSSNEMTKKHDMPVCHYMLWMLLWYLPFSACKEPLPG